MRRLFINIVSSLSLLLCMATAGLWVRSYWKFDIVHYRQPATRDRIIYTVSSCYGSIRASYACNIGNNDAVGDNGFTIRRAEVYFSHANMMNDSGGWYYGGCGYANPSFFFIGLQAMVAICFPHWLLLLLFAIPLLSRFVKFRRQRNRLRKGLCLKCGYDLRASEDRCLECGTAIPADVKRKPIQ